MKFILFKYRQNNSTPKLYELGTWNFPSVACPMACVTLHKSCVTFLFLSGQSRWRICYQRGYPVYFLALYCLILAVTSREEESNNLV